MPVYETVTFSRNSVDFSLCFYIEIYRLSDSGKPSDTTTLVLNHCCNDLSTADYSTSVSLASGSYRIIAVARYTDSSSSSGYYDISADNTLIVNNTTKNIGNSNYADVFCATQSISVDGNDREYNVELTRPVAKYEILATDVAEFIAQMQSQNLDNLLYDMRSGCFCTRVSYTGFKPTEYNLTSSKTSNAQLNIYYDGALQLIDNNEAVLAYDYVLVNPVGTSVTLAITIYDSQGDVIANSSTITVPLMPGKLTIVKGNFLTTEDNGVGISPDYLGPDYNYKI